MLLTIHPENPQERLIREAVAILMDGGILVYPTDSSYALCCRLGNQQGMDRIRQIRQVDKKKHYFSLVCEDLSELSQYARVDNSQFRLLKAILPGAYTLILEGTREVPKRLLMPGRNTVGLRVPNHNIVQALLKELGEPLLSTTLTLPNLDPYELNTPSLVEEVLQDRVDAVIDGGACPMQDTTVIDLSSGTPEVLRVGLGSVELFES